MDYDAPIQHLSLTAHARLAGGDWRRWAAVPPVHEHEIGGGIGLDGMACARHLPVCGVLGLGLRVEHYTWNHRQKSWKGEPFDRETAVRLDLLAGARWTAAGRRPAAVVPLVGGQIGVTGGSNAGLVWVAEAGAERVPADLGTGLVVGLRLRSTVTVSEADLGCATDDCSAWAYSQRLGGETDVSLFVGLRR